MGGGMPFHLEKGVLGLRLDYLTRSPAVRNWAIGQMQAGANPFVLVASIPIPGSEETINAFNDPKAEFIRKLELLNAADPPPSPPDPWERRSAQSYWNEQDKYLLDANNDHTGNRNAFRDYWLNRLTPKLIAQARVALLGALQSGKHHIDYWWDCSLKEGDPPQVIHCDHMPGAAHVFFVTDHTPVEPPDTPTRLPLDAEPGFAGSLGS